MEELVVYRSEYFSDDSGMSCHEIVEDMNGNVILSRLSGDWTSSTPNAHGCPGTIVPKNSLTWLFK